MTILMLGILQLMIDFLAMCGLITALALTKSYDSNYILLIILIVLLSWHIIDIFIAFHSAFSTQIGVCQKVYFITVIILTALESIAAIIFSLKLMWSMQWG